MTSSSSSPSGGAGHGRLADGGRHPAMRLRAGAGGMEGTNSHSPRAGKQGVSGGSGRPPLPGKLGQKHGTSSERAPLSLAIPSDPLQPEKQASAAMAAPKLEAAGTDSLLAELAGSEDEEEDEEEGSSSSGGANSSASQSWASKLVLECARAVASNRSSRVQQLLWVLNELASPYGDCDQRLACYMLQALFCKVTANGARCYRILCTTAARTYSFESMRTMILKFQDASPWTTFGHVASNGALMEAFEGESRVHIVDVSNTFCTQWPTLFEALATRPDGAPHLRLTTVIASPEESAIKVMRQIGGRMEKFARLMGVPFEFAVVQQPQLEQLDPSALNLRQGEALAINCMIVLHQVSPHKAGAGGEASPRDALLTTMRRMNPKIVTLVEHQVDSTSSAVNFPISKPLAPLSNGEPEQGQGQGHGQARPPSPACLPLEGLREALRFYSVLFDSLEESLPRVSNERLMIERSSGRAMVSMLACDDAERSFWYEKGRQWGARMAAAGFGVLPFNDDVVDDVRALLKRHKEGWGSALGPEEDPVESCLLHLTWKQQAAIFASAWRPMPLPD